MCGLAGVVIGRGTSRDGWDPTEVLERMSARLAHRGPDDAGLAWDGRCGLAHRRLSVIDLSTAGRQPMQSPSGATTLVWNGELYNFRELKRERNLERKVGSFRSRSDTEVVLHLLEQSGHGVLDEFDGMFALAAWDNRTQRLLLARDRFGIKPLFLLEHDGCFWFASEIKALLEVPGFRPEIDLESLHHFFGLNYIPGSRTAFAGIRELAPGTWLEVGLEARVLGEGEFGQLAAGDGVAHESIEQAAAESTELLRAAVQRQLVSDVPVGVMLSGGLDSSALAALYAELRGDGGFHTFSLGFDDPSFDESPAARQVAQSLGTEHHEIRVRPERVIEVLRSAVSAIDEPYADGSAVPTWLLAESARDHVTVLLSGEAGDELHAGYDTHAACRARLRMRRVPGVLRRGLIRPLVDLLPVSHRKLSFEFKAKRFIRGVELGIPESHCFWREVLSEDARRELITSNTPVATTASLFRSLYESSTAVDPLDGLLEIDRRVFLPDDLMVKNDRMTMVHSLEARVPFTDIALARRLVGWPPSLKLRGLCGKQLLRRGLVGRLPEEILSRKKVGLEMPYSRWLTAELKEWAAEILLSESATAGGVLNSDSIGNLWEQHQSGRFDHGRPLWGLLNFLTWHDLYMGPGDPSSEMPAVRSPRHAELQS